MKLLATTIIITAFVCVAWLTLATTLVGWGLLLRRAYRVPAPRSADALFDGFWTGVALVLLYALVVNFVWRLDWVALTLALAIGLASAVWNRRAIALAYAGEVARHRWTVALGIAIMIAWTANHAIGPITFYDSAMYHVGTVEWANRFAVVPGLGNLHDRFAYNSASLLLAALLDAGPLDGLSSHLVNGLLLVVLATYAILAVSRFMRGGEERRIADLIACMMLPIAVLTFLGKEARSLSTDAPAMLFVVAAALRIVRSLERPEADHAERAYVLSCAVLCLAAAVTVKLSTIAFAAASIPIALVAWRLSPAPALRSWKPIAAAFVLPVALGLAWVARGVVLSGYPAYPLALGGFPVSWRLPEEQARAAAAWISTSARALNEGRIELGSESVGVWTSLVVDREDLFLYVPLPVLIVVLALIGAVMFGGLKWRVQQRVWLVWIPVLGSIFFWAIAAPHPRFAGPYFWLAAGLSVALLYERLVRRNAASARSASFAIPTLAVILTASFVAGTVISRARRSDLALGQRLEPALMLTWWDRFQAPYGQPDLVQFRTESGLTLHVPRSNNLCWRGPLLCTPHPAENLQLRSPGDLSRGFRIQGAWDARRWPNPWSPFLSFWRCLHRAGAPDGEQHERACLQEAKKDSVLSAAPT
jgi:hypothetical protein